MLYAPAASSVLGLDGPCHPVFGPLFSSQDETKSFGLTSTLQMSTTVLELYCCLQGDSSLPPFPIQVDSTGLIHHVKTLLLAQLKRFGRYHLRSALDLMLYKRDERELGLLLVICDQHEKLAPCCTVALYWPCQPLPNTINIIIGLSEYALLLLPVTLEEDAASFTIRIHKNATVDDLKVRVLATLQNFDLRGVPSLRLHLTINNIEPLSRTVRTRLNPHLELSSYWPTQDAVTGTLQVCLDGGPRISLWCFIQDDDRTFQQTIGRDEPVYQLATNIAAFLGLFSCRPTDVVLRKILTNGDRVVLELIENVKSYWPNQPESGMNVEVTRRPPTI